MASNNDGNLHERFSLAGGVDDDTNATIAWLDTAAKTSAPLAAVESRAVVSGKTDAPFSREAGC